MGLFSFLKSGKNPAEPAMPYLNQIPSVYKQNLNPYIKPGLQAGEAAQARYAQLASNPRSVYDELMAGYTPSSGFEARKMRAQEQLGRGAAGLGGSQSGSFARTQADAITRLLLEDEDLQRKDLMQLLGLGLQGQELGAQRGFGASTALADALGTNLSNQASLAFRGQQEKNAARAQRQGMFGQLAGMLGGNALGAFIGGGNTPTPQAGGYNVSPYAYSQMFGQGLPGF